MCSGWIMLPHSGHFTLPGLHVSQKIRFPCGQKCDRLPFGSASTWRQIERCSPVGGSSGGCAV